MNQNAYLFDAVTPCPGTVNAAELPAEIEARMEAIQLRWQLCDEANAEIEKERAPREAARAAEHKDP
jgi:hypothetical protein